MARLTPARDGGERGRRPVRRWAGTLAFALLLWTAVAAVQLAFAARSLQTGRDYAEIGRDLLLEGNPGQARFDLGRADDAFGEAARRLRGPGIVPLRVLPVLGANIGVIADLADAGSAAAEAAEVVADGIADLPDGVESLAPAGGALPLDALSELARPLRRADALLQRGAAALDRSAPVDAVGRVAAAREELEQILRPAAASGHAAAAMARALPEFMGANGPRRYLLVAQNPAESRGTGGFVGSHSVVTLREGRLEFGPFGDTPEDLPSYPVGELPAPNPDYARRYNRYGGAAFWNNINLTPDFPSAAAAMEALYARGTGQRLDGTIAVDPLVLPPLLEVAGPVRVPQFGEVGPDEVVDVVTNRAFNEITDPAVRKRVLGTVFVDALTGFLQRAGGDDPLRAAGALAAATGNRHLLLHAADPDLQEAFVEAGVAGRLLDPPGDFLAVVTNAGSAAKLDYYIDRDVRYEVRLGPGGLVEGDVDVVFDNDAPTAGVDTRVIGPNVRGLRAGEQRLIVSVFGPDGTVLDDFARSEGDQGLRSERELGHAVFTTLSEIRASASQRLRLRWRQAAGWETGPGRDGGTYRLTLQGQTTIRPTDVEVIVSLPAGTVPQAISGELRELDDGRLRYEGPLRAVQSFEVRFAPPASTGWERVWQWLSRPVLRLG